MKLSEWFEENKGKEVVFEEDGKLSIKEAEPNGRWKPIECDQYYMINTVGSIIRGTWIDSRFDRESYSIGDVFRTKAEAESAVERLKIRAELLDCGGKEVFESSARPTYTISYTASGGLRHSYIMGPDLGTICFESQEKVYDAMAKVGVDRIKKYFFGIEE